MRLDKFLKVSRIIKRRPVAKIVVDNKKVKINSKVVKAGTEVKVGDILEIEYFNKYLKIQVLEVPQGNVSKDRSQELYKLIEAKGIEIQQEEDLF